MKQISEVKDKPITSSLKVLSSEILVSFESSPLKGEARRFPEKSVYPPSLDSLLKIPRHLKQLLAIRILFPYAGMNFIAL
jgi:hypothetical protein